MRGEGCNRVRESNKPVEVDILSMSVIEYIPWKVSQQHSDELNISVAGLFHAYYAGTSILILVLNEHPSHSKLSIGDAHPFLRVYHRNKTIRILSF